MEISYLFSVLRRRWWFPLVGLLLGLIAAALFVQPERVALYEARAVLNIQPPENAFGSAVFQSDPDRYVIGQLSVLRSSSIAEDVAAAIATRSTEEIVNAVTISHEPKTDIVTVIARMDDPNEAERVANGYVDTYIRDLRERAEGSQEPQLDKIEERLKAIEQEMKAAEEIIQKGQADIASRNLQLRTLTNTLESARIGIELQAQIDALSQTVATAVNDRNTRLAQYTKVLDDQSQLELVANLKVASEPVQRAVAPTFPISTGSRLPTAAGGIVGLVLGLAVAVFMARFSGHILEDREIYESLGVGVSAEIPRVNGLSSLPALLDGVPDDLVDTIDQLVVRAETKSSLDSTLTIAVVGSMRPAGVTTLAVAMASRFAEMGSTVVLIDADSTTASITNSLASSGLGFPALLLSPHSEARSRGQRPVQDPFVEHGSVLVLGLGPRRGSTSLRRHQVSDVLEAARREAQVVIIDGGEALESSASLEFCRLVDAVILAIPVRKQKRATLVDLGIELADRRRSLLPVITRPGAQVSHGQTEVVAP